MIIPSPNQYTDWKDWANNLTNALRSADDGPVKVNSTKMPPAAANKGLIVYVMDLAVLKASNGTTWKTITWT